MARNFLTAEWRNLLMANYAVGPDVLKRFLPCRTELDEFNGVHYVSLVGFLFKNTKVRGFSVPFHRTFEEVNLRFYVRYKEDKQWKRGVVFIRELVPRRLITFVANTVYKEKYRTHRMRHVWRDEQETLRIEYHWRVANDWNYLKAVAEKKAAPAAAGSEEEFITEHYWGYTFVDDSCTGTYEVTHPRWAVHQVLEYDIHCDAARLYGTEFVPALNEKPRSVFLAEGSAIEVKKGSRLFLNA